MCFPFIPFIPNLWPSFVSMNTSMHDQSSIPSLSISLGYGKRTSTNYGDGRPQAKPFSIHPTILNLPLLTPPSIINSANKAVDIIMPSTYPLSEKEWDLLDEAVSALDKRTGEIGTKEEADQIVICEFGVIS